ncbi:MAG: DnaD domain protein [Bacilli bacterium]|nr:DnaD domain protein [Bacilli bacterium]MCQ2793777.1 DnaD domain protein [Bacilli bacterium]
MNNNTILAINFEYALMEFYKKLSLSENDVAVLFMIKHLLEQNNSLITADLLAIKMNLPVSEIDQILVNLMHKKYLAYNKSSKGLVTSLHPLEEKLSEMYQMEIAKDASQRFNEANLKAMKNIYEVFERELGRTLSPVELSLIDEWVMNGYSEEVCVEALHEALSKRKNSLKAVDKILMKWQARDDMENVGHTAISGNWKKNINQTLDIVEKKWGKNDEK